MRKTFVALLALSALTAVAPVPAAAWGSYQQDDAEQRRRELERRMREHEEELRDMRRQMMELEGDPRVRISTPRARIGPFGNVSIFPGRPKLGFMYRDTVDAQRARVAEVVTVAPGSPAERAGLKAGDVIIGFKGVLLQGRESPAGELRRQAEEMAVGDTIQLEYRRGAERKTITLVAEDLDPGVFVYSVTGDSAYQFEIPRVRVGGNLPEVIELSRFGARWLDMELVSLEKDLGEYFGATEGVLVVRAPRDTALNLRSGDVILTIEGRKAMSPTQVMRILRSYEAGESFGMQVMRQKRRVNVPARVPAHDRGFFHQYEY